MWQALRLGVGQDGRWLSVLALLADQFAALGKTPRIALAAPTGKAAARMADAIVRGWTPPATPRSSPPARLAEEPG